VDSILIDEARNPFIISVPDASMDAAGTWRCAVQVARRLKGPKDRIDTLTIDASEAAERIGLDFSADFRLKTARMTQGGMGRAIRI